MKLCGCLFYLNEQVAYKGGWPGQKKKATGINYCQNGRLAKAKVTLVIIIIIIIALQYTKTKGK